MFPATKTMVQKKTQCQTMTISTTYLTQTFRILLSIFIFSLLLLPIGTSLTLSRQRSLSYRNQSIDLQNKSMDRLLYDRDLLHERVNGHKSHPDPF